MSFRMVKAPFIVAAGSQVNAEKLVSLLERTAASPSGLCLVTILSGCEINNFAGSRQSRSAITWLPCLTCFDSGSEPCFACFGRAAV